MIKITTEKINDISPVFYGVFFEDINYGGDGGLYAELIANRSFEYYGSADGKMCWEKFGGIGFEIKSENTPDGSRHYCRLTGEGGIRNTGFGGGGFAVRGGGELDLCCIVRGENVRLDIVISDKDGNIYGQTQIFASCAGWSKYEMKIKICGESDEAFLSINMPKGGEAEIDFISLFPETFRARKNGMRKDIAEAIADLHPKFMRFPGGCIVEGRSFENMYNWKDTIGPVDTRRTNMNRWQMKEYQLPGHNSGDYFQSYGIGFYEYFQFCEDIGAKPVPVVNCGMTCQWHEALLVDTDKLTPFIQDVFDLIEFANAGEESEWGRKRIEMGHKEPFGLEYIGIGNEQWGEEYFERYDIFQKAVSERYPHIKLITSAGWKDSGWEYDTAYRYMRENKNAAYAVDEHFYKEPEWFINNINRYDDYDRTLPKVFIGEYAAHTAPETEKRENNWVSAVSEAAFLTGAEKNADHVVMTCYAPLLAKVGHQQWQPDLIWFDNSRVYLTPNYYIQKFFSEYLCEYSVRYECGDEDIKMSCGIKGNKIIAKIVNITEEKKEAVLEADGAEEGRLIYINEKGSREEKIKCGDRLIIPPQAVIIAEFAEIAEICGKP